MSLKDVIFPATERILSVEKRGDDVTLSEPMQEEAQVVFGLRPCDAHGVSSFDGMFLEKEPIDLSYARRRERTTLIGMACPQMWEECFCTIVGGAPDVPSHLDVLLTAREDGYAIRAVTSGSQAMGEVTVRVSDGETDTWGRGASTDIIEASVKAYLDALNRLAVQSGIRKQREGMV